MFVLILHVPSLSLVGPKIFRNIFLSNTNNVCFMDSVRTHVVAEIIAKKSKHFWDGEFVKKCFEPVRDMISEGEFVK